MLKMLSKQQATNIIQSVSYISFQAIRWSLSTADIKLCHCKNQHIDQSRLPGFLFGDVCWPRSYLNEAKRPEIEIANRSTDQPIDQSIDKSME